MLTLECSIKANGEIVEADIINLFVFTLRDNILEWGKNYAQNHPNYTFEELEQAFCKRLKTMKNDEKVYIQL
jgi:ubiquinone biosynthesis protein COQ9